MNENAFMVAGQKRGRHSAVEGVKPVLPPGRGGLAVGQAGKGRRAPRCPSASRVGFLLTLRHRTYVKRQDVLAQMYRDPATALELRDVEPGQGL